MAALEFPTDRAVGTLDWIGAWSDERGPVVASGSVFVPDGVAVGLNVQTVLGTQPTGGGAWSIDVGSDAVDLRFLRELPADSVESLTLSMCDERTVDAIVHLAPGLRQLYLPCAGFGDVVLEAVAMLSGLTYLQTWGNDFTDSGVQRLVSLANLDHLYLEEATLTAAAFEFTDRLPGLERLGLQDVPISAGELEILRARLPGVDVG